MKTREVYVCKSDPVASEPVLSTHIHIQSRIPTELEKGEGWESVMNGFYTEEAERIERALWGGLPAGTYDRLLAAMLKRAASLYHLSHGDIEERDR